MDLTFGDVQETALIPLAIKASETARANLCGLLFGFIVQIK